jgi:hypothetical protein
MEMNTINDSLIVINLVNTLKEAMQVEDTGRICTQIAELQRAKMVLGQVMYSGAA